ncbi:MAG: hypothetical protein WA857_15010 [Candidatus Acidiferrum sp.]
MPPKRKKREKTELEKMSTRKLVASIRKDLHTMVLEAEAAIDRKPKKDKG